MRTDDRAALHPKFFSAGCGAFGWWGAARGYANFYLTDGFVPGRAIGLVFPGSPPADVEGWIDALIREHVLHRVEAGEKARCHHPSPHCPRQRAPESGYIIHDYFEHQPRAKDVREKRRTRSGSGRQGGLKSAETRQATRLAGASPVASTMFEANGNPTPTPTPTPTKQESLTALSGDERPTLPSQEPLVSENGNGHHPTARDTREREYREQARGVIRWLNNKAGKNFPENETNLRLVMARLRDGVEDWQLKAVISLKTDQWKGDPKMAPYLRPKTLFNATNFASYLGELPTPSRG